MLQLKRQEEIMALLAEQREMTVKELCAALYTSPATIRRDLSELEQRGLLRRSFGGAVLTERYTDQLPLQIRRAAHIAEKKRIALKAVRHIAPGDTVFLDASSTTYFLSEHLAKIPELTVITNNPHLSTVLASQQIRTLCTGGEMLHASVALVGREAEHFVGGFSANACFFSARGFAENEASDSSKAERDIKIAMLERAKRHFFLCDSSKFGQQYAFRIGNAECFDEIIDES